MSDRDSVILDHHGRPFKRGSLENPSTPLSDPDDWLIDAFGATPTTSGVRVNRTTALTDSAWFRGVNLVASTVAKLPLFIYERTERDRVRAKDHPAYRMLRWKPNREMIAFDFWRTIVGHKLTDGGGYAFIDRDRRGVPRELLLLLPDTIYPVRVNGRLWYYLDMQGRDGRMITRLLDPSNVLHLKGWGFDGLEGYSVLDKAREQLGLGLGAREHGTRFFSNAAAGKMVLEHPATMSEAAQKRFIQSYNRRWAGLKNAHKTIVLEEGMKAKPMSVNAKDAQLIELLNQHVRQVANFIGVPPHKLGDAERVSYNSLEQENQSFLDDSIDHHLVGAEQELRDKLLTEDEKDEDSHTIEFMREAAVRIDFATRMDGYSTAVGRPFMTPNEARAQFNMDTIEGGDELAPPPNASATAPAPAEPPEDDDAGRARRAAERVLTDAVGRMRRRLCHAARRAAKSPERFDEWLEGFRAEHEPTIRTALEAPAEAYAAVHRQDSLGLVNATLESLFSRTQAAAEAIYSTSTPPNFERDLVAAMDSLERNGA